VLRSKSGMSRMPPHRRGCVGARNIPDASQRACQYGSISLWGKNVSLGFLLMAARPEPPIIGQKPHAATGRATWEGSVSPSKQVKRIQGDPVGTKGRLMECWDKALRPFARPHRQFVVVTIIRQSIGIAIAIGIAVEVDPDVPDDTSPTPAIGVYSW